MKTRITISLDDDLATWVAGKPPSASAYVAALIAAQRWRITHAEHILEVHGIGPEQASHLMASVDEPPGMPGGRRLDMLPPDLAAAIEVLAEERAMTI